MTLYRYYTKNLCMFISHITKEILILFPFYWWKTKSRYYLWFTQLFIGRDGIQTYICPNLRAQLVHHYLVPLWITAVAVGVNFFPPAFLYMLHHLSNKSTLLECIRKRKVVLYPFLAHIWKRFHPRGSCAPCGL